MKNNLVRNRLSPARSDFPRFFDMMNDMDTLFNNPWGLAAEANSDRSLAVDVSETEKEYLFTMDVPGMKEKDINVSVTGHQLSISGERRRENEDKNEKSYRSERFFGRFERTFLLPEQTNTEQIEASFQSGVLKIRVPKVEAAQAKTITIKPDLTSTSSSH